MVVEPQSYRAVGWAEGGGGAAVGQEQEGQVGHASSGWWIVGSSGWWRVVSSLLASGRVEDGKAVVTGWVVSTVVVVVAVVVVAVEKVKIEIKRSLFDQK